jgi:hypothetical protein
MAEKDASKDVEDILDPKKDYIFKTILLMERRTR